MPAIPAILLPPPASFSSTPAAVMAERADTNKLKTAETIISLFQTSSSSKSAPSAQPDPCMLEMHQRVAALEHGYYTSTAMVTELLGRQHEMERQQRVQAQNIQLLLDLTADNMKLIALCATNLHHLQTRLAQKQKEQRQ